MTTILVNDGIPTPGKQRIENAGFEVLDTKVARGQLANFINEKNIAALLVRSATQVDKALIDACPSLKLIGRGGVGMDNIDVAHAKAKGLHVINTPAASSQSVAELVIAHMLTGLRFLHVANREMPLEGDTKFKQLKKSFAAATEAQGKTLGILGFGRIGRAVAKLAIGMGMKVMVHDPFCKDFTVTIDFFDGQSPSVETTSVSFEELLRAADILTVHVPSQDKPLFTAKEFGMMKKGTGIINASRGGILDEIALMDALDSDQLAFAGLDVFENEPQPQIKLLMHPKVSLSPHVGGSTQEAQERIGLELAEQLITLLK